MATLEERVNELSSSLQTNIGNMEEWRKKAEEHLFQTDSKVAANEANVQWLIRQFEQMSHKDKDGQKGLKKAFGSKGSDLKPE
eukprot:10312663-Karenia_brevis.AAC.1